MDRTRTLPTTGSATRPLTLIIPTLGRHTVRMILATPTASPSLLRVTLGPPNSRKHRAHPCQHTPSRSSRAHTILQIDWTACTFTTNQRSPHAAAAAAILSITRRFGVQQADPALPSYFPHTEPMRHQGAHPVTYSAAPTTKSYFTGRSEPSDRPVSTASGIISLYTDDTGTPLIDQSSQFASDPRQFLPSTMQSSIRKHCIGSQPLSTSPIAASQPSATRRTCTPPFGAHQPP